MNKNQKHKIEKYASIQAYKIVINKLANDEDGSGAPGHGSARFYNSGNNNISSKLKYC